MIKVENLTKKYAGQTAIRDLNFEVGQGEIMGFLGPNGAGKTTTMRILASFLPATSGRASIAGFDVFEQSLQARAHLGYMPENVPLYGDMRVSECLNYRAALKSIPHRRVGELARRPAPRRRLRAEPACHRDDSVVPSRNCCSSRASRCARIVF